MRFRPGESDNLRTPFEGFRQTKQTWFAGFIDQNIQYSFVRLRAARIRPLPTTALFDAAPAKTKNRPFESGYMRRDAYGATDASACGLAAVPSPSQLGR